MLYTFVYALFLHINKNCKIMERVTEIYLTEKGFEKDISSIGWSKFRKNEFELVEIPLAKGGFVIGFEYQFKSQTKYKYPLKINELHQLYRIITGTEL